LPRSLSAALLAGVAVCSPALAHAAAPPRAFDIPAKPTGEALIDFAVQAAVSIDTGAAGGCGGRSRAVRGRFTPEAALAQLLAGGRCTFVVIDARTFRVQPRHDRPAPAPPPRPDAAGPPVDELVVTATKREVLIDRSPYALSSLSRRDLERQGAADLSDLASQLAGITLTNLGSGRDKILIRGLSDGAFTGRTQSTVGLYLDDVPITYNAPDPDLRLVDMDRIEVLRGPQGTLYGAGSIGGVIHMVTRKPDLDGWAAAIGAQGQLTQSGSPSHAVDWMLNIPIVRGRLAVWAVGYSEIQGGYIDDAGLGLKNVNRTSRAGGRMALRYAATPNWTLSLGLAYQGISSADTQYAQGGLSRYQRDNSVREPHDNDFNHGFATLEGQTAWGRLKISASQVNHSLTSRYDATLALAAFLPGAAGAAAYDENDKMELFVTEATLSSTRPGRLQWLAGLFFSTGEETLTADLRSPPGAGAAAYREVRTDEIGEIAVYGEATYALTSRLSVTGGLRAVQASRRVASTVATALAPDRGFDGRFDVDNLAPKAVVSFQASDRLIVYGQAAEGHRIGGFNTSGPAGQVFPETGAGPQPDRRYSPDELWSFEVGAKLVLNGGRIRLRTAAYYATWYNIQSDQYLPSGLPYTANVGDGVVSGLEAEGDWRLGDRWTLRGAMLLNNPELTHRDETAATADDVGLPGVPRVSASAAVDYRRPLTGSLAVVAGAKAAYVGPSHLTFEQASSARMGGYLTGRLSMGLESPRMRLTFFVDNPANTAADTFAFGNPFSMRSVQQVTPLRPRTVGLAFNWAY